MNPPELASGWSRWPAPAKLNLFLSLVGRRDDGYHLLQTLFQLLRWGDAIDLRLREDAAILRTAGVAGVPPEQDLVVRAARALQQTCGIQRGVDIAVHKQIPLGGGFGGGSSNAATVLVALNALWRCGRSVDELAALGLSLGADVPVFVRGRTAWAEGVGERLQAIDLPETYCVVLDTGEHIATGELFQAPELTRNAPPRTMVDWVSDWTGDNAFAPVVRARSMRVAAALSAIADLGRGGLTGTGGGCFLLVEREREAIEAAQRLARLGRCWVTRTVNRSPLLDRLESC